MVRLALLAVALACVATASSAQTTTDHAEAARDLLYSLESANAASELLAAVPDSGDMVADAFGTMVAQRRAISRLRAGIAIVTPHTGSADEQVSESASVARRAYENLIAAFESGIQLQQDLIDLDPAQPFGPVLRRASESAAASEDAWRLLPLATAAMSHAMVDNSRLGDDGTVQVLTITAAQRAELLLQIGLLFGEQAAAGEAAGLRPAAASAALFAYFLRQPWKNADDSQ